MYLYFTLSLSLSLSLYLSNSLARSNMLSHFLSLTLSLTLSLSLLPAKWKGKRACFYKLLIPQQGYHSFNQRVVHQIDPCESLILKSFARFVKAELLGEDYFKQESDREHDREITRAQDRKKDQQKIEAAEKERRYQRQLQQPQQPQQQQLQQSQPLPPTDLGIFPFFEKEKEKEESSPRGEKKVVVTFISRKNYMDRWIDRQIGNEDEVVTALRHAFNKQDVEFQAVDFAAIPVLEQLHLVARTDILVGFHGAGLTHVIFQPTGTSLSPHSLPLPTTPRYSSQCNTHYTLHTTHYTLHTTCCALHNAHYTLHNAH